MFQYPFDVFTLDSLLSEILLKRFHFRVIIKFQEN